jgi:hypothetical protein
MAIPEPARWRVERRLELRRRERWPALGDLKVRYRGDYAYVSGTDPDGPLTLCRLHWTGSPDHWGFACYLASKDGYEDSILPTGSFTGTPEEALDCVCGLYLNDPSAWAEPLPPANT